MSRDCSVTSVWKRQFLSSAITPSMNRRARSFAADPMISAHRQHHTKPGSAADHLCIGFVGLFERIFFDHRPYAEERAELHRFLGIIGGSRGPAGDLAAARDQLNGSDVERFGAGAD